MYKKNSNSWLKHSDFIFFDLLCIQIAFLLSYFLRHGNLNLYTNPIYKNMNIFILLVDITIIFLFEEYKNVLKRGYYIELISTAKQSFMLLLTSSLYLITEQNGNEYSRIALYLMVVIYFILTYIARIFWKKYLKSLMKKGGESSLIIITTSKLVEDVVRNIKGYNYERFQINGIIILNKDMVGRSIYGVPVVADNNNAAKFLCQGWVDEVFVNLDETFSYPYELIDLCIKMGLAVHLNLAKISDNTGGKQTIEKVGKYTVLTTTLNYMTEKEAFMKRMVDIIFGVLGCIATGIIYLFIAPIIYIKSPGPIFFSQERVGENGKTFKMYKFRSMYMDAEKRKAELMKQNKISSGLMFKMDFDPRIIGNKILPDGTKKTGIGQFIRSTSLDEFPQFWNVLKGEMSTVGFRPALPSEYAQYEFHHRARIAMKPGVTGMWQVSGRSDIIDFEEVVRLDTEYIKNWSMGLDFKILLKTFAVVLKKDGSM